MLIDLLFLDGISGLKFSELANVQTVGIGLYLALAVIQAVSTTGLSGLSRRLATLRNGVATARLGQAEASNIRRLSGEVSGLEIDFHAMNRRLLWVAFVLFLISLIYFSYCTFWQKTDAGWDGVRFIIVFYLIVPIGIFAASSLVVAHRCRTISRKIADAEKRIRTALLALP